MPDHSCTLDGRTVDTQDIWGDYLTVQKFMHTSGTPAGVCACMRLDAVCVCVFGCCVCEYTSEALHRGETVNLVSMFLISEALTRRRSWRSAEARADAITLGLGTWHLLLTMRKVTGAGGVHKLHDLSLVHVHTSHTVRMAFTVQRSVGC